MYFALIFPINVFILFCCYLRAPWRSQATLCLKFSKYWSIYGPPLHAFHTTLENISANLILWHTKRRAFIPPVFSYIFSKVSLNRAIFNLHIFINTSLKQSQLLLAWLLNFFVPIPIIQFQSELHLFRCLFQEHDIPWAWRLEISPIGPEPKFQLCLHLQRDFRRKHFFIPDRFLGY